MSLLDDVILDDRRRPPQMQGLQAGRILSVGGGKVTVSLELFPDQRFVCTWGRSPSGSPEVTLGARCLVAFVGQGINDPWVVAIAGFAS